uniref:Uncharacterized protein n=1 Tax=Arundo donax TaxID=35708 RepID=A0A0A9BYU4_ARUDO
MLENQFSPKINNGIYQKFRSCWYIKKFTYIVASHSFIEHKFRYIVANLANYSGKILVFNNELYIHLSTEKTVTI